MCRARSSTIAQTRSPARPSFISDVVAMVWTAGTGLVGPESAQLGQTGVSCSSLVCSSGSMYSSSRFVGLSLWLCPDASTTAEVQSTMDDMRAVHGTPRFDPHVTLIPGIRDLNAEQVSAVVAETVLGGRGNDAATATPAAAAAAGGGYVPPLLLQLQEIGRKDMFFQSLFAAVAPAEELMALRRRTRQALVQARAALRADVDAAGGKEEGEEEELGKEGEGEVPEAELYGGEGDAAYFPHLSLVYGDLSDEQKDELLPLCEDQLPGMTFAVGSIKLVQTEGDVSEWRILQSWKYASQDVSP